MIIAGVPSVSCKKVLDFSTTNAIQIGKTSQIDAGKLKGDYQSNKWKIQLLGDEDEYETLNESINKLIIAIEEKD